MPLLELVPKNWYSWNFDILQNGGAVAQIQKMSSWKDRGEVEIEGVSYELSRERLMSGEFLLRRNGSMIAHASKPSVLRNLFDVEYGGRRYTLKKASWLGRAFVLMEEEREVGSVRPVSIFGRRAEVALPDEIPLAVGVFLVWLVLILWRREQKNSAAAAAAGT